MVSCRLGDGEGKIFEIFDSATDTFKPVPQDQDGTLRKVRINTIGDAIESLSCISHFAETISLNEAYKMKNRLPAVVSAGNAEAFCAEMRLYGGDVEIIGEASADENDEYKLKRRFNYSDGKYHLFAGHVGYGYGSVTFDPKECRAVFSYGTDRMNAGSWSATFSAAENVTVGKVLSWAKSQMPELKSANLDNPTVLWKARPKPESHKETNKKEPDPTPREPVTIPAYNASEWRYGDMTLKRILKSISSNMDIHRAEIHEDVDGEMMSIGGIYDINDLIGNIDSILSRALFIEDVTIVLSGEYKNRKINVYIEPHKKEVSIYPSNGKVSIEDIIPAARYRIDKDKLGD